MLEVIFSIFGTILGAILEAQIVKKTEKKRHQKRHDFKTHVPWPTPRSGGSSLGRDGPRAARVCRAWTSPKSLGF